MNNYIFGIGEENNIMNAQEESSEIISAIVLQKNLEKHIREMDNLANGNDIFEREFKYI